MNNGIFSTTIQSPYILLKMVDDVVSLIFCPGPRGYLKVDEPDAVAQRRQPRVDLGQHRRDDQHLGSGRIVVSEKEAPNMLVILV